MGWVSANGIDITYVETPGVSHVAIDPDSSQVQMKALLEFLADR